MTTQITDPKMQTQIYKDYSFAIDKPEDIINMRTPFGKLVFFNIKNTNNVYVSTLTKINRVKKGSTRLYENR